MPRKAKPMPAKTFRDMAEVAFGPEWKTVLAEKLECTRESVWRYATGRTPIPEHRIGDILTTCGQAITRNMDRERRMLERIGNLILR